MKKIFIIICTLFIAANVSAQTRRIGDIIMVNGELGVVFVVTTDGQHGKAISVSETKCNWDNAKTWCANYGMGWKLPTKDELLVISRNRAHINYALETNGYRRLGVLYWSSETYSDVYIGSGDVDLSLESGYSYVRAVSIF